MINASAIPVETILLIAAVMLLLSILASKASGRLGVPALLFFLGIGMLAGSDGPGGIYLDNPWLAQFLGSIALAYILFSGGMDTKWRLVRPVLLPSILLATLGVILTAGVVGLFVHWAFKFPILESLLLGSIISSTDAAAVFSILRSKSTRLKGNLEPLLEMESGCHDPMAILLTLGFTHLLNNPGTPVISLAPMFFVQFGIGGVCGLLLGKAAIRLINGLKLNEDGLYPVLTTAIVILIYGLTASLGGNGFLAVYIAGLILGNSSFVRKKSVIHFHDGLAWLMQIVVFLMLGLQVFPSRLPDVAGTGLLLAAVLIFLARPLSVFFVLWPFKFSRQEKTLIAWVGLRGVAPIVLATFPLLAGLPEAGTLFHLIFFVVLVSVLLQGSSISLIARLLKVNVDIPASSRISLPDEFTERYGGELEEILIPDTAPAAGKRIVDLNLPAEALVVLVKRGPDFIIPRGDVELQSNDQILIAADATAMTETRQILCGNLENR